MEQALSCHPLLLRTKNFYVGGYPQQLIESGELVLQTQLEKQIEKETKQQEKITLPFPRTWCLPPLEVENPLGDVNAVVASLVDTAFRHQRGELDVEEDDPAFSEALRKVSYSKFSFEFYAANGSQSHKEAGLEAELAAARQALGISRGIPRYDKTPGNEPRLKPLSFPSPPFYKGPLNDLRSITTPVVLQMPNWQPCNMTRLQQLVELCGDPRLCLGVNSFSGRKVYVSAAAYGQYLQPSHYPSDFKKMYIADCSVLGSENPGDLFAKLGWSGATSLHPSLEPNVLQEFWCDKWLELCESNLQLAELRDCRWLLCGGPGTGTLFLI